MSFARPASEERSVSAPQFPLRRMSSDDGEGEYNATLDSRPSVDTDYAVETDNRPSMDIDLDADDLEVYRHRPRRPSVTTVLSTFTSSKDMDSLSPGPASPNSGTGSDAFNIYHYDLPMLRLHLRTAALDVPFRHIDIASADGSVWLPTLLLSWIINVAYVGFMFLVSVFRVYDQATIEYDSYQTAQRIGGALPQCALLAAQIYIFYLVAYTRVVNRLMASLTPPKDALSQVGDPIKRRSLRVKLQSRREFILRTLHNVDKATFSTVFIAVIIYSLILYLELDDIIEARGSSSAARKWLRFLSFIIAYWQLCAMASLTMAAEYIHARRFRIHIKALKQRSEHDLDDVESLEQLLADNSILKQVDHFSLILLVPIGSALILKIVTIIDSQARFPPAKAFTFEMWVLLGLALVYTQWYRVHRNRHLAILYHRSQGVFGALSRETSRSLMPKDYLKVLSKLTQTMFVHVLVVSVALAALATYLLWIGFPTCFKHLDKKSFQLEEVGCTDSQHAAILTHEIFAQQIVARVLPLVTAWFCVGWRRAKPALGFTVVMSVLNLGIVIPLFIFDKIDIATGVSFTTYFITLVGVGMMAGKEEHTTDGRTYYKANPAFTRAFILGGFLFLVGRTIIRYVFIPLYIAGSDATRIAIVLFLHPMLTSASLFLTHQQVRWIEKTGFAVKGDFFTLGTYMVLSFVNRFYYAGLGGMLVTLWLLACALTVAITHIELNTIIALTVVQTCVESIARLTYFHRRVCWRYITQTLHIPITVDASRFDRVSQTTPYYMQFTELFNILLATILTETASLLYDQHIDSKTLWIGAFVQLLAEVGGDVLVNYTAQSVLRAEFLHLWMKLQKRSNYFLFICTSVSLIAVLDGIYLVAMLLRAN